MSLSLQVDDATVDAANKTLSWTVSDQPWHDGDLLMLRIKEVVPEVAIEDVPSTITQGLSATFTIRATGLSSSERYSIGISTDNDHLGLGQSCGTLSSTGTLPSAITSHTVTKSLHGCRVNTGTLTATLLEGTSTVGTASADVEVEPSTAVTVSLSPREAGSVTKTNITIEWNDPDSCQGRYFVALYDSNEIIVRNMGSHPAPETTTLSKELPTRWEDIPNDERLVRVTCRPNEGSSRIVGEVPLRSGLP